MTRKLIYDLIIEEREKEKEVVDRLGAIRDILRSHFPRTNVFAQLSLLAKRIWFWVGSQKQDNRFQRVENKRLLDFSRL